LKKKNTYNEHFFWESSTSGVGSYTSLAVSMYFCGCCCLLFFLLIMMMLVLAQKGAGGIAGG